MLNLSLKEFALSSLVRDSEYAFYAADSGTECAFYWDLHGVSINGEIKPIFPITGNASSPYYVDPIYTGYLNLADQKIKCNGDVGVNLGWPYLSPGILGVVKSDKNATTTFYYNVGSSPKYCVVVQVIKGLKEIINPSTGLAETTIDTSIDARGYNVPCYTTDPAAWNDPNKIERAIRTDYPREYF